MNYAGKTLTCVFGTFLFCTGTHGNTPDSSSNPYQGIVDRNVFGLRPPPPPPSNEPVRPPPPAVSLTGITTILGKKLAFMNVQIPPKPGEQAKPGPQSFMLGIGEREGEIEVLEIDEKGGVVKVNDYGVITNVPFAKIANTPAAPVNTAGIPSPGVSVGNPLAQRSIPGLPRTMRTLGGNVTVSQGNGSAAGPTMSPGLTGVSPATTAQAIRDVPMSGEEQVIMMEAQRERLKSNGDPTAALLPPTELTSPEDLRHLVTPGSRMPKGYQQPAPLLPQ
jgi:hypothetical protein